MMMLRSKKKIALTGYPLQVGLLCLLD